MGNIKVKVENNIDELVSLFSELGCKYFNYTCSVKNYMIFQNGKCFFVKSKKEFNMCDCKELTIQQLKDMVVLKRNDVCDATHTSGDYQYYLTNSEFFEYRFGKWVNVDECVDGVVFEPIEKKEMKEYLRKNSDGEYILEVTDEREAQEPHAKHWIEVPKGYDYLVSSFGINAFVSKYLFNKVSFEKLLWSRNVLKEFLVNYEDKWTLQLLDSDTEENSYRVAVPSGATFYAEDSNMGVKGYYFFRLRSNDFDDEAIYLNGNWMRAYFDVRNMTVLWQRSETEYLMQCENGEKLMESIAKLNNQDTVKVSIDELKHRVYKKDVSHLKIVDVYRVLELFGVESHAVGHAIKKLLCSGGRGAKDEAQDIQEAIDSLIRYQEMKDEDE